MVDSNDTRRRQDFDDQQNELAGRNTGRMTRFGVGNARTMDLKDKERRHRDALDQLLLDPDYLRLYEELGDALGVAESGADTAIADIQERLRLIELEIETIEGNAARDLNGNLVFRYADGRTVYADGSIVPADIAEGIIWPTESPTAEHYFAAKDRQSELQRSLEEWLFYRTDVLGGIRDRYDDRNDPLSKDDIRGALEEIERERPSLQMVEAPAPADTGLEPTPTSAMVLPTVLN